MLKRILFVDDERSISQAFAKIFSNTEYEILVAGSGEEALTILKNYNADIIVADLRMPNMSGQQLLLTVKKMYPSINRMIVSSYIDENEVIKNIISGLCSTYILKPWEPKAIYDLISQLLSTKEKFHNNELLLIINQMENLSMRVGVYNAVNQLIEKDANIQMIARVIQSDPTVTVAVLRVANSAYSNLKTSSLTQAIAYLGLYVIRNIILSSMFKTINTHSSLLHVSILTKQANSTNYFVSQIYEKLLKKKMPDSYATAGLLHSLGLIICLHYFPGKYSGVIECYLKQTHKGLIEYEKEQIAITHNDIGGYLLSWWGIPYPIVEVALYYHDPMNSAIINKELVNIVHVASYYAWRLVRVNVLELDINVLTFLGLEKNECQRLLVPGSV